MKSLVRRPGTRYVVLAALCVALLGFAGSAAGGSGKKSSPAVAGADKTSLIVLSDDVAPGLDIDGPSSVNDAVHDILENIMEPMIEYPRALQNGILTPQYKIGWKQFKPRLATSWTHPTPTKWIFHLRKGVKSCAGNEFTADDVVWSFARAKSVSGASPIAWFLANIASVLPLEALTSKDPAAKKLKGEVKKIDDYTVEFNQANPNDLFPRMLTIFGLFPYDSKEMLKHATKDDPWAHKYADTVNNPGFGPYCVKSWNKGSEIVLEANPGYFRGQPQFTKVIYRKVPAAANRVAALRSGDADVTINLAPRNIADLRKDPNVHVFSFTHNEILAMGFNFALPPWNLPTGKLIRQAVAWAFPYNEIIKQDYVGDAKRWYGLVEPTYVGYKEIRTYAKAPNLAKAKALLAKAGFPGGKGLDKYSQGLKLNYVADRRELLEPIANRIKTALATVGIPITLDPITGEQYNDRELKGDMPMFLRDRIRPFGPDAAYAALLLYVSKKNGGLLQAGNYANATVDKEFFAAQSSAGAARLAHLAKIQDIVMDELPQVPILLPPSQLVVHKGIWCWQTGVHTPRFWYMTANQTCSDAAKK